MTLDLHSVLPAGEWANLQVLNGTGGMMAGKDWAIFAKAKHIRAGGRSAFLKFVVAAGSTAGDTTLMVTGRDRLGDLFLRLKQIQQQGETLPLVPLLEVQHTNSGLLIAMEEVTPLQELIERGEAYHLSVRVLADLDPDRANLRWHHFDVCPNNIGLLRGEHCVLIDVESFYLESNGRFDVSVPAWKPFRAPADLAHEVQDQLAVGDFQGSIALRKLRYEIALAAAECVLGPIPYVGSNLDRSTIERWVAKADAADPAVQFWKRELLAALNMGSFPPLHELRTGLESALRSERSSAVTALVPSDSDEGAVQQETSLASRSTPSAPAQSEWTTEWALVLPMVHALRAGRLGVQEIVEYRQVLQQLASRFPTETEVWNELLLVVISFEKDPTLALSVVVEALHHLPTSEDLLRTRNIVQMWARERRHGR